tara:strand:+ start:723 stop:1232 length:510 start_codon:yes stop_codon:yes gene_type:complete
MNCEYLSKNDLKKINFKDLGQNVMISKNVTLIGASNISLGSNVRIDDYCIISSNEGHLKIGSDVHIGGQSYLGCAGGLSIGSNINIAQGVKIYTKINDYTSFDGNNNKFVLGKIDICDQVIIGSNSVLIGKCTIGEGATIGALSFVKSDLKPWSVYAGNPIKLIKDRIR